LSLFHGVWTTTRSRIVPFVRLPGTTIWWPASHAENGETVPGVLVAALQAPLSFLNAYEFQGQIRAFAAATPVLKLIVLEAHAVADIDYTGAKVLADVANRFAQAGVAFAIARMESVRAQESFERNQLAAAIPPDHLFHSVEEAVAALAGPATPR